MKTFLKDFKKFAMKGNVIDLAVAVVIGAAFGKIVSALVDTIVMPLIGILLGSISFDDLTFVVGDATIAYGKFIQATIDFIIIALVIFIAVRVIGKMEKKEEEKKDKSPKEPSEDILLLREIRDAIKK